jgi:hypothetical protein
MQDLLAEGDFVRSLARQLIGGADADDLEQDTWLAALRAQPRSVLSPRAWLARIVVRVASNRRRGERRRAAREHTVAAVQAVEAPSTAEVLACEQVRQRVVAAVLALDEPFRATVLARFLRVPRHGGDRRARTHRRGDRAVAAQARSGPAARTARRRARCARRVGRAARAARPRTRRRGLPTGMLMSMPKKMAAAAAVLMLAGFRAVERVAGRERQGPAARAGPRRAVASTAGVPRDVPHDAALDRAAVTAGDREWGSPVSGCRIPCATNRSTTSPCACSIGRRGNRSPAPRSFYAPFHVDLFAPLTRRRPELCTRRFSTATCSSNASLGVRTDAEGKASIRQPGWVDR